MKNPGTLTIDKIPVRLSLLKLGAQACLTASARNYFSALGKHPQQHPLMHQIDRNPDCQSLAICSGDAILAHCFFHDRTHSESRCEVQLHTFMVAPHMRHRGVGSLLFLHLIKHLINSTLLDFALQIDFPQSPDQPGLKSNLARRLARENSLTAQGQEVAALLAEADAEAYALSGELLHNLIVAPEFRTRVGRAGCHIGTMSEANEFFAGISSLAWPPFAVLQSIHPEFHQKMDEKLGQFDVLVLDSKLLATRKTLMGELETRHPDLPLILVGAPGASRSKSVLLETELPSLPGAMHLLMAPFAPVKTLPPTTVIGKNLLHLPDRGSLAYYRNHHRGQRLFIAASGPSLNDVNPADLEGEVVMTINDALKKFPKARYAAIMDARKLHELHMELRQVDALFTLTGNSLGIEIDLLGTEGFSLDAEKGLYSGYTTAYFCLQLALHMGFREINYLGLDMGNTKEKSHFFGNRALQDQDRPEVYAKMRLSFEKVTEQVAGMGVAVYNCSPVSELKCFPFRPLKEALNG